MAKSQVKTGGIHDATAALKNVLAAKGVTAPHTKQPYTEAMLLGIGGGLGMGYILWEFKSHRVSGAIIVIAFRNRWNYTTQYLTTLCERLGVKAEVQETAGTKGAAANLEKAPLPVVAWVDKAHLPHQQLPEALMGHVGQVVGIYEVTGDHVLVDDLSDKLFTVPADIFAAGRARIGSDKNRLLLVTPHADIDLAASIEAGIRAQLAHLGSDSESFSLPAIKKWAKLMTHPKDKKGWPVVFASSTGLYGTLRSVFEGVTLDGTDGSGLRDLYADFLDEAANIVGNQAAFRDAAAAYRQAGARWREFAEAALPDIVPDFARTKVLLRDRYARYKAGDLAGVSAAADELAAFETRLNADFPLDATETRALFAELQARLNAIYDAETVALDMLRFTV